MDLYHTSEEKHEPKPQDTTWSISQMSKKRREMIHFCLMWGQKGDIASNLKMLDIEIKGEMD